MEFGLKQAAVGKFRVNLALQAADLKGDHICTNTQ